MALFGSNKKGVKKEKAKRPVVMPTRDVSHVIGRPVITEKAARLGDANVYAFFVAKDATERDVRDAVASLWNVAPVKINMVTKRPRTVFNRAKNRSSVAAGSKKAYIYLAKGDRIDLV